MILAIDPGHHAGAALWDGESVAWWATWRRHTVRRRPVYLVTAPGAEPHDLPTLAHVGGWLASGAGEPGLLIAEGQHIRRGVRPDAILDLAFGAGLVTAPLLLSGWELASRPQASEWSRAAGISTAGGARAMTDAAYRRARVLRWSVPMPSADDPESLGAVCEAVVMASCHGMSR